MLPAARLLLLLCLPALNCQTLARAAVRPSSAASMTEYGYRYYAADKGRWINRDPIEDDSFGTFEQQRIHEVSASGRLGGAGEYSITGNDFLNHYDLLGLIIPGDPDPTDEILIIAALRKALLELLKKRAIERAKKIAECEAIYAAYKAAEKQAAGCKACLKCPEYTKLLLARAAEVAGRGIYLKKQCDYILPGSIAAGSKGKETAHRGELASKIRAFANCTGHAIKERCAGLPQLPAEP